MCHGNIRNWFQILCRNRSLLFFLLLIKIFASLTMKSNCDTKSVVLFSKLFFFLLIHLISHLWVNGKCTERSGHHTDMPDSWRRVHRRSQSIPFRKKIQLFLLRIFWSYLKWLTKRQICPNHFYLIMTYFLTSDMHCSYVINSEKVGAARSDCKFPKCLQSEVLAVSLWGNT